MALAFFRRRQKMVLIIMAILMVSFLIGFQGFEAVLHRNPGSRVIGKTSSGKITENDLRAAENDLRLLSYVNYTDLGFQLVRNSEQPVLVYVLLLREAQGAHVRVGQQDVSAFFVSKGLVGAELQSFVAGLKSVLGQGVTAQDLREAVERWLKVNRLAAEAVSAAPVSRPEIETLYRDLNEKIKLDLVTIRAEDFLDQVGEPNAEAMQAQFAEFRTVAPGQYTESNPFGFGYLQPNRARILYLLVRQEAVRRAIKPRDETARDYYRRHAAELVRKVPVEPDAASFGGATQTASKPVEYREVPLSFAEAKAQIIEKLTEEAAQAKTEEIMNRAVALLEEFPKSGQPAAVNPYRRVREGITSPAEGVLARRLEGLKIDGEPLERAVEIMAEKAGLERIVFPWGDLGDRKLDPAVKVRLSADSITLGEALDRICQQIKWPKLQWAASPLFEGVLFSVAGQDGVDFFPVTVKETKLMDARTLEEDPVLGKAVAASGEPLVNIAFTAEPFARGRRGGSMLKVNDDGPRMDVGGQGGGKLLWRLAEALPVNAPATMDGLEGLAEQVRKDCQLKAAFELAVKRAEQVKASASKSHLASAAKREKLKVEETELFSRRVAVSPARQYAAMAQLSGRQMSPPDLFAILATKQPFAYPLSPVEEIRGLGEAVHAQFIDAAFSLAPADVEPPYPKDPPAVELLASPATREVFVMERTGYQPAVWSDYRQKMGDLVRQMEELRRWQGRMVWFSGQGIAERMRFESLVRAEG